MFVVGGTEPELTEKLCSALANVVREVPMNDISLQRSVVILKVNQRFQIRPSVYRINDSYNYRKLCSSMMCVWLK
jgi:hypothetical protein